MDKIAFIYDDVFIYWSTIILTIAAVTAIIIYAAVYIMKGGSTFSLSLSVLLSLSLGIILARLMHWYCQADGYQSFSAAMTDYSQGGFGLMGVFFGCLLSVGILRLLGVCKDWPVMLDAMSIGGGLGIAIGRLASLFNASDRGTVVPDAWGMPFASPVVNVVSGLQENRLATFMIQSMLVGSIVAGLAIYMVLTGLRKRKIPDGDVCLMFLLMYGAVQIVCDSTRYDSMFLRSNRFVSLVQILGLVALLIPLVFFSVRMVKRSGFKPIYLAIWGGMLAMMGLAGYMEYYVQRNGDQAVLAYSVMSAALIVIVVLGLTVRWMPLRGLSFESILKVPTKMAGEKTEKAE